MVDTNKTVAISLKLRDSETVRTALVQLGAEGQKALSQLTAGAAPASRALEVLNVVGGRASGAISGLAGQAGGLSEVMAAFGPVGLGIGAAVGSVVALASAVKQAAAEMAELKKSAEMAGVGVEALQRLEFAGKAFGITTDGLVDGLKELSLRADEFAVTGAGSAEEAFTRLGYSQQDVNAKLQDTPKFLLEIADKMAVLDKASQIRIADELFGGEGGEQFVAMLSQGSGAIAALGDEAERLGYVIDSSLVNKGSAVARDFEIASESLRRNFMSFLIECAPLVEALAVGVQRLALTVNLAKDRFGDWFAPDLDQQLANKEESLAKIQTRLMEMDAYAKQHHGSYTGQQRYERGGLLESEAQLSAEIEALQKQRDQAAQSQTPTPDAAPIPRPEVVTKTTPTPKAATTLKATPTRDQAGETVASLRLEIEQLEALAEAHHKGADAVRAVDDAIAVDQELKRAGVARNSEQGQSIMALTLRQQDLKRSVQEREQAEREGEALTVRARTAQDDYAEQVARVKDLLDQQVISQQTANSAMAEAQQQLEAANRRQLEASREWSAGASLALRDYVDDVTNSAASTRRALSRGLESVEDFFTGLATGSKSGAEAFRDMANSIVNDLARMMVQRTITAPLADGLGGILSGVFGASFGGTGSGGGVEIPGFDDWSNSIPGFASGGYHSGGLRIVGEQGPEIEATGAARIWTASQTAQMLAGGGGAAGGVVVNVFDQRQGSGGDPVAVQQSTGGGGMRQIDIMIAEKVDKAVRSGRLDDAFSSTYGVRRQGVRRG